MKTYTSKSNEDLGSIASKFGMPSWKYLYELNKEAIGDNPDLLKEGTKLKIPQWDSTGGDEKIKAKDADPLQHTGGASYRYPWVALSASLVDRKNNLIQEKDKDGKPRDSFEKAKKYRLIDKKARTTLAEGQLSKADEIEILVPDSKDWQLSVDGVTFG